MISTTDLGEGGGGGGGGGGVSFSYSDLDALIQASRCRQTRVMQKRNGSMLKKCIVI